MKTRLKILIITAVFSLAIFGGCSNDAATPVSASSINETPDFLKLPERMDKSLAKAFSVTKFIYAAEGGTVPLLNTYRAAPDSHLVTIDVALDLKPGDLPNDASLTISLDDVLFLANVDMTFGPHGVVFNHGVKLSVHASGLDAGTMPHHVKLYCITNGVWEKVNGSNGVFSAGTLDAQGKLSHFSQYAFRRVED